MMQMDDRIADNILVHVFRSFAKVFSYAKEDIKKTRLAVIMMIVSTIIIIYIPSLMRSFINSIAQDEHPDIPFDLIMYNGIVVGGLILLWMFLSTYCNRKIAQMALKVTKDMRTDINRSLLDMEHHRTAAIGDLTSRMTNDMSYVFDFLAKDLIGYITHVVIVIIAIIVLLITDIRLGIVAVLALSIIAPVARYYAKRALGSHVNERESIGMMNGMVSDAIRDHRLMRTKGIVERSMSKFDSLNSRYRKNLISSSNSVGLIEPIVSAVMNLSYVIVACIVTYTFSLGEVSSGSLVLFLFYFRIVTSRLTTISTQLMSIQSEIASLNRIFQIIEMKPEYTMEHRDPEPETIHGRITARNLSFSYPSGQEAVKDVSFTIEKGECVAITGMSGSGKSTLMELMMGALEPTSGEIDLDGQSIPSLGPTGMGTVCGTVIQEPWVFKGTVRENILYGLGDRDDEEVVSVTRRIGLHDFIMGLPEGYDTVVNDSDGQLGLDERRLISIARVLLKSPKILLMDEPTSGLDPHTAKLVMNAVKDVMKGKTVVFITHSRRVISTADRVLTIDEGRLVD